MLIRPVFVNPVPAAWPLLHADRGVGSFRASPGATTP